MSAQPVAAAGDRTHRHVEQLMGMPVSLALRGRHAGTPTGEAAWRAVVDQLREVDRVFSTYRADSIMNRLDRGEMIVEDGLGRSPSGGYAGGVPPRGCPPEVAEVLELGRDAELQSDGAFSIMLPTPDGRRRLDPSGIVKGWAVERASRILRKLADTDFCLSAGGDMVCHTAGPGRPEWKIGIEDPRNPKGLIAVVPVRSGAVATSGTAHRGAHLVDPRTGEPPTGIASVTVIADSLTWVDIDATAAYVLGRDAIRWLQGRPIRSALVVWADGTTTRVVGRVGLPTTVMSAATQPFAVRAASIGGRTITDLSSTYEVKG